MDNLELCQKAVTLDKVVHFEIPADDVTRAEKFYSTVFGWKTNRFPGMDYTMLSTSPSNEQGMPTEPGAINGGMPKRQDPVKSTVITINVTDIDEALKKIGQNGGEVARGKQAVGDMGYTAYFKDSEGNVVGLWQNK